MTSPSLSVATQNEIVGQDTLNRKYGEIVVGEAHVEPFHVISRPLASTATQKGLVAHEMT
jgi:hypothetical protein